MSEHKFYKTTFTNVLPNTTGIQERKATYHVKHAVSLVEDQVRHTLEVCVAGFEVIDETTWCCDDDFNAAL